MKHALHVLLLMVALLAPPPAHADDAPPSVQAQVMPLLDEMMAAANAHDTDRFMALYARGDALVVQFDDQTLRGWQTVRDQQDEWWPAARPTRSTATALRR